MNTISQAFDSRSMALAEPSTAPSAFSLWRWFSERAAAKASVQPEANASRAPALESMPTDPRSANDLRAATDL